MSRWRRCSPDWVVRRQLNDWQGWCQPLVPGHSLGSPVGLWQPSGRFAESRPMSCRWHSPAWTKPAICSCGASTAAHWSTPGTFLDSPVSFRCTSPGANHCPTRGLMTSLAASAICSKDRAPFGSGPDWSLISSWLNVPALLSKNWLPGGTSLPPPPCRVCRSFRDRSCCSRPVR